jgi:HD-GYP domain-containing protein (c-di-GMP phosphodiesterase class II)
MSVEASAATPLHADELGTELVARARTRARSRLVARDGAIAIGLALAFVAAALGAALFLPAVRPFSLAAALIFVLACAIVSRVEFEINNGGVIVTQLVLVPMLFALPPRVVPLAVAAGFLLGRAGDLARGRLSFSHIPVLVFNASYSLGPAIVLALAGAHTPSWQQAPIYVGALAAQFAADFVPNAIWSRLAWSVPILEHARTTRVAFLVDSALAPVGLVVAIAAPGEVWGVLLVLPLVALLKVFARERQVRIDHALQLSTAYRGTAILLGDVIEADDQYTGAHSRDVVELVLAVSDKLGLDPRERQRAEFAALLHDVGKVKIPTELINKPGPLEPAERALMNTHTIIGQNMLDQVGGMLGEVGHIVRSCHERWDGAGYPDGLAREHIPLAARIVCACDAWSAMTSDRSYRKALPRELAAAELCACAGTQFDPRVVAALVSVLGL